MAQRKPPKPPSDVGLRDAAGHWLPGVKQPIGKSFAPGNSASSGRPQFDFQRLLRSCLSKEDAQQMVLGWIKQAMDLNDNSPRAIQATKWMMDHTPRFVLIEDDVKTAANALMDKPIEERVKVSVAALHAQALNTGTPEDITEALKGEKLGQEALRSARDAPAEEDGRDLVVTIRRSGEATTTVTTTSETVSTTEPPASGGSDG